MGRPDADDGGPVCTGSTTADGETERQVQEVIASTNTGPSACPPGTPWETIGVAWYDGETTTFEMISQTALWHRDGFDPVPIR